MHPPFRIREIRAQNQSARIKELEAMLTTIVTECERCGFFTEPAVERNADGQITSLETQSLCDQARAVLENKV